MGNLLFKIRERFSSPVSRAELFQKSGVLQMGNGCEIYNNVNFGSEPYLIRLGSKVRITAGVRFVTHDGGLWVIRNLGWSPNADKMGTITIGDNVFIGWNSIVMSGVTIGSNVIIGSGSIVTKDIPDNTVVAGVPAKIISTVEEYYHKNLNMIDDTKHLPHEQKKLYYQRKFGIGG